MSRKPKQVAAGAVVLRTRKGLTEVLMVHRPRYKDWSLPKGKPEHDEDLPATARREVAEETGVTITLGISLGTTSYQVNKQSKVVHWWLGRVVDAKPHKKDREVDKVRWLEVKAARKKLSHATERKLLDRALAAPQQTGTLLVVRHGKAMLRRHWSGSDARRPMGSRGRRQAKRLAPMLAAYGVSELVSSSSTRCLQTLEPTARALELPISAISLLSEEEAEHHGSQVRRTMRAWALRAGEQATALAVCGHRPVLPDMRLGVGVSDKPMLTAETLVVHLLPDGSVAATETHKSAF